MRHRELQKRLQTDLTTSRAKLEAEAMAKYNCSRTFVRGLFDTARRQQLSDFVASQICGKQARRPSGSTLSLMRIVSKSAGQRMPGGGRTDHLKNIWKQTARWGQHEEALGQTTVPDCKQPSSRAESSSRR